MRAVLALALAALALLLPVSCGSVEERDVASADRPNIVLMVVEDLGARIGAFGDPVARTPNIDRLAREGVRYTHAFATAGVCAPSRAALITGMNQVSITAQHMRTTAYRWADGSTRQGYLATPPAHVKAFPELLRAAGYYTTNNSKTDYQFGSPFSIWDQNGESADWKGREKDQPFFAMYSSLPTHESGLFTPDSVAAGMPSAIPAAKALEERRARLSHRTQPEDVVVPPYYPDTPVVRADIARQYDNIQLMDAWVGERMAELEREGVLDNTIVIWTTDHGDGFPRAKRSLYDSGLNAPMIIRFPDGRGAGTRDERMISFVDLAPTILKLAGAAAPAHLQGQDMLGPDAARQTHVFAARDRLDEWPDLGRAVRTRDFKYIVNEVPEAPLYLKLNYRENVPMMADMRRMFEAGALSPLQASYFETPRPAEELYDLRADPDEIRNLAADPAYAAVKSDLAARLSDWRARVGDPGAMPEERMIKAAWATEMQPRTAAPMLQHSAIAGGEMISLSSETPGASIGYRLAGDTRWRLYTGPVRVDARARIEARAIRYGFEESETVALNLETP